MGRVLMAAVFACALTTAAYAQQVPWPVDLCPFWQDRIEDARAWERVCVDEYQSWWEWLLGWYPEECAADERWVEVLLTEADRMGCEIMGIAAG